MADKKQLQIVLRMKNLASKELKKVQGTAKRLGTSMTGMFKSVGRAVFSLKGAIVGLVAVLALRKVVTGFVDVAAATEQYGITLRILLGDVKEANLLFENLADLASRVPFQYKEIMESAVALGGVMKGGREEIMEWLPLLGDLAAVYGMRLEEVTSNFIRLYSAGAGAARLFMEKGILAMAGFIANTAYTADESKKMLMDAWKAPTSKFRGAMKELAKSYKGLTSMMADAWFQFRDDVMRAGVFDFIKRGIQIILAEVNRLKSEGRLKEYAKDISNTALDTIEIIIKATYWIRKFFVGVQEEVKIVSVGFNAFATGFHAILLGIYKGLWWIVKSWDLAIRGVKYGFNAMVAGVTKALGFLVTKFLSVIEIIKQIPLVGRTIKDEWVKDLKEIQGALKTTFDPKAFPAEVLTRPLEILDNAVDGSVTNMKSMAARIKPAWDDFVKLTAKSSEISIDEIQALIDRMRKIPEIVKEVADAAAEAAKGVVPPTEIPFTGGASEADVKAMEKRYNEAYQKTFGAGLERYTAQAKAALKDWGTFSFNTAVKMENAFSNVFFDVFTTKVGNAREHFKKFLLSILKMITDMMAQKVVIRFLQAFGAKVAGGAVSPATTPGGGTTEFTQLEMPKLGFAKGGIVNQPTLGLIGEGRRNEAIVPLPDNRSIPVTFKGGAEEPREVNVNFNITTLDARGFSELLIRERDTIQGIIANAMRSNRDFRKVMA